MNTEFENGHDTLTDETRQKLKNLSGAFLRLHKVLLDGEKEKYEAKNGKIPNANMYLSLVLDDPQFAWLRKISSLIALIDEADFDSPSGNSNGSRSLDERSKNFAQFSGRGRRI